MNAITSEQTRDYDDRHIDVYVLPLVGHFAFRLAWVARKTAS